MTTDGLKAELLSWFNQQMDLSSAQIDIVDGFVFMLKKIRAEHNQCFVRNDRLHNRFWKAHNRAFGYRIQTREDHEIAKQMQNFYWTVALQEEFLKVEHQQVQLTEKGHNYLQLTKEQQLEQILMHIWL
ncbi:hypothetical protein [Alkalicoccobacillus porphyridii]|uniref:Uncharacterized protein n=1 Tax=Alkalicoccobacillus porphyridii TaxID=2597270 RepID=A0A553ZZJ5_9BACI|nr:hypothetical protein [Alkalicoccobacillus porphyridii]TSB46870.1 hypothetical protein FN960_07560 [Alkalicoccobacillus porphyridii]